MRRWMSLLGMIAMLMGGVIVSGQRIVDLTNYREVMIRMVGLAQDLQRRGQADITLILDVGDTGDPLYIAPLIDLAYFMRDPDVTRVLFEAISKLSGETATDWQSIFQWAGANDIALPPHYDEFKGLLLSVFIDAEFARFFAPGVQTTSRVNMVEVVWGGVVVDGIPSLVNTRQITPEEAQAQGQERARFCRGDDCSYPASDELVFGLRINDDARAYPLRLLNWHEMFNDVVGHTPMRIEPEGEVVCNFRAPTPFSAVGRAGDAWIAIDGISAGCPRAGWVAVEAVEWLEDATWEQVMDLLPDALEGEPLLGRVAGVAGRVRGTPVMLAYCTLCGSGILYDTTIPALFYTDATGNRIELGETVLEFGSTGLLMRSNKLMYDRNTDTVWNALTGEPAFGRLVDSGILLELLPVVVTDWATWLQQHPDTSVLSLQTGYERNYANGAAYTDYFNNPDFIMFPVWQQDTSEQAAKEMIFGLRLSGVVKAYPLDLIISQGVVNDVVADQPVVIISQPTPERDFFEPGGAAVRAYAGGIHEFIAGPDDQTILDGTGGVWRITENALVGPDGAELARIPGHLAFWFGWYGFYPDTLVYAG